MQLQVMLMGSYEAVPTILFGGVLCATSSLETKASVAQVHANCISQGLRFDSPALVIADYRVKESSAIEVHYLKGPRRCRRLVLQM